MSGFGGGGGGRGGRYNNDRGYHNKGRGGGNRGRGNGGRGPPNTVHADPPRLKPCRNFVTKSCDNSNCGFAHVVKMHASIAASSRAQSGGQGHGGYSQGYSGSSDRQSHPVTGVSIWESPSGIKIFSGSRDGHWRLWNTANAFEKEFEHNMTGKVACVEIRGNILFVGFEGHSIKVPDASVGMVHAWDLNSPNNPPLEFWMEELAPYAHSGGVSCIWTKTEPIITGSLDATIRTWKLDNGKFAVDKTLSGHAGEITGLAVIGGQILWSSSTDCTLRLWDLSTGQCRFLINKETNGGHTKAITGVLALENEMGNFVLSCSLDETVKAWNGMTGECMASESHGQGVICIEFAYDLKGNPLLLCGLESGSIMIRNVLQKQNTPAFCLLCTLSQKYTAGHSDGPVRCLRAGPQNTFYSGGSDGKLNVWQITGDFGL